MSPARIMRGAAALMGERRRAAADAPWRVIEGRWSTQATGPAGAHVAQVNHHDPAMATAARAGLQHMVGLGNPVTTAAIEQWLNGCAMLVDDYSRRVDPTAAGGYPEQPRGVTDDELVLTGHLADALEVARGYLTIDELQHLEQFGDAPVRYATGLGGGS